MMEREVHRQCGGGHTGSAAHPFNTARSARGLQSCRDQREMANNVPLR